jgi:hypothetical protein
MYTGILMAGWWMYSAILAIFLAVSEDILLDKLVYLEVDHLDYIYPGS